MTFGSRSAPSGSCGESLDEKGQERHWILEIHSVDTERRIGGFYEELLTVTGFGCVALG